MAALSTPEPQRKKRKRRRLGATGGVATAAPGIGGGGVATVAPGIGGRGSSALLLVPRPHWAEGAELGRGLEGGVLAVVHPVPEVGGVAEFGERPTCRWGN